MSQKGLRFVCRAVMFFNETKGGFFTRGDGVEGAMEIEHFFYSGS